VFVSRSRRGGPDPTLQVRMALFAAGAVLGGVGIMRDGEGWWVLSGIAFLGAGMIVSLVESVRRRREAEASGEPDA
jgi:hypothetical protein